QTYLHLLLFKTRHYRWAFAASTYICAVDVYVSSTTVLYKKYMPLSISSLEFFSYFSSLNRQHVKDDEKQSINHDTRYCSQRNVIKNRHRYKIEHTVDSVLI